MGDRRLPTGAGASVDFINPSKVRLPRYMTNHNDTQGPLQQDHESQYKIDTL